MGNTKFSLAEKKLFRTIIAFVLIQLFIIIAFICVLTDSQQISVNDTKQIDIIVDDIYYTRVSRENCLFVVSNSTKYLFKGRSTFEEHSVSELYESIFEGDKLSLMYYETRSAFGKVNLVVDARSETEIYRTIEEYNSGKQGLPVFVVIIFSVMELILVGVSYVYVWLNYNVIKGAYRKLNTRLRFL